MQHLKLCYLSVRAINDRYCSITEIIEDQVHLWCAEKKDKGSVDNWFVQTETSPVGEMYSLDLCLLFFLVMKALRDSQGSRMTYRFILLTESSYYAYSKTYGKCYILQKIFLHSIICRLRMT